MPDREKVVSTFEKIISVCKEDGCDFVDLTFDDAEQILAMLKEQQEQIDKLLEESASNAEMAEGMKELLKEQEAVEPFQHDAVYLCGNCDKEVVGWTDDITGEDIRYQFCRQCGRSVKWE